MNANRLTPRRYWSTGQKFLAAAVFALCWMSFSVWLSVPWVRDSARIFHLVPALLVISLLAYLPGLLVAFLVASVLLDRQPPLAVLHPTTRLTVVIAARNEQDGLEAMLAHLASQDYEGPVTVVLVDNGSSDHTAEVARRAAGKLGLCLSVLLEGRRGKSHALNAALELVETDLVVTVDADTLLHPSALRFLVARLESSPSDVAAVAGCVLVRNSRDSLWARAQEWDYFLGIASVKRMQGLYQETLVAQGAFSLYRTQALRDAGGWPDAIGEDIVLTWRLMQGGARIYFEPLAVAFTTAPERFSQFARQRVRWARGMIEALRAVPPWRHRRGFATVLTSIDLAIPLLDGAYVLVWIPGVILACFGTFWFVGPMTAAVLPLTLVLYGLLSRYQRTRVFEPLGLQVRRNTVGFLVFLVVYQLFMSSFSVLGYGQELVGARRRWK